MNQRLTIRAHKALIEHAEILEACGDTRLSTALTMLLEWYAEACASSEEQNPAAAKTAGGDS